MSLLMDALKRAETSKQEAARQQGGKEAPATTGGGLSLEPLPREGTSGPLPDLASHLDAVDAELASSAQAPAAAAHAAVPPAAVQTAATGQAIARNTFAAKQGPADRSRTPWWLALGVLGVAALAIAAYVWFQLNALGSGGLAPAGSHLPPTASAPPPAPAPAVANSAPPLSPAPASESRPPESFLPPPSAPARAAPALRAAPPPAAPIRLSRTPARPDPDLAQAHAQLQAGDLQRASQHFAQTLQRDPNNTDALLALAAIAQHQGRQNEAEGWRQRALIADPSNPAVQAAALGGRAAGTDPQTAESRLKTLLAAQPQSAELNFTLGNLYARQQRWSEAQQAYFNAVATDADNPDYLFNLAVSLDQLHQPRPAARHYGLALEAATRRPATFDGEQVRRRLADLQP